MNWRFNHRYFAKNEPVAFVGDVHGCRTHLVNLLQRIDGRHLIFVGDLIDKGPESGSVLTWIQEMYEDGQCSIVLGNHDYKLLRYLKGNPVTTTLEFLKTLQDLNFKFHAMQKLLAWLETFPICIESEDWLAVHAAFREGVSDKETKQICLYGETDQGQKDIDGFPVRTYGWREDYVKYFDGAKLERPSLSGFNWDFEKFFALAAMYLKQKKLIVHGHDAGASDRRHFYPTTWQKNGTTVVNIDTGAVYGGPLTALLYPEMEIVQTR